MHITHITGLMRVFVLALLSLFAVPVIAFAESTYSQSYFGLILRSAHTATDALNDNTPGLTFGLRTQRVRGYETFWEAGVFYNSYEEVSPILLLGASAPVWRPSENLEVRLAASIGTAYYGELSESLEQTYGIPNIGGFIPMAALSVWLRTGETDIRLTSVPAERDVGAVLNLSVAIPF